MRIYLRPVCEEDGKLIVKWRNSPNVLCHCMDKSIITEESNRKFYRENVETGKYAQYIVERVEETTGAASYPIATVYLKDMDKTNGRCELCIFTSNDEEWNTQSQSIAVKMLVDRAFQEFGMHKIYSYVFYKYIDEVEVLKRAGFRIEAVLREEVLDMDGNYEDVVRLSVIRE